LAKRGHIKIGPLRDGGTGEEKRKGKSFITLSRSGVRLGTVSPARGICKGRGAGGKGCSRYKPALRDVKSRVSMIIAFLHLRTTGKGT